MERDIAVGNGGWLRVTSSDNSVEPLVPSGTTVYARVEPDESGRLQIGDVLVSGVDGGRVTGTMWRNVKLGAIEKIANRPEWAVVIRARLLVPGPPLAHAASFFTSSYRSTVDHWAASMLNSQEPGSRAEWPEPTSRLSGGWPVDDSTCDHDLSGVVPTPNTGSDEFLAAVGDTYRTLVDHGIDPAPRMREANGIERVSTVHYWIRRARERGLIARGRRGRAG